MIAILGGGPAGRIAAIRLADAGKDVRLIESGTIGGQCLGYGCMPVCGLNDAVRVLASARRLHALGILDSIPAVSFENLMKELGSVQKTIAGVLDSETRDCGVEIIYGKEASLDGR